MIQAPMFGSVNHCSSPVSRKNLLVRVLHPVLVSPIRCHFGGNLLGDHGTHRRSIHSGQEHAFMASQNTSVVASNPEEVGWVHRVTTLSWKSAGRGTVRLSVGWELGHKSLRSCENIFLGWER